MRTLLVLPLLAVCALAQEPQKMMLHAVQSEPAMAFGVASAAPGENVKGAPYSATITTEMTQTLADGNKIVQRNQSGVARDSQGRTRNEAVLPAIGNLNAKSAPKIVFINDPVAGVSYSLNDADKSYRKMPAPTNVTEMKYHAERKAATVTHSVTTSVASSGGMETVHLMTAPEAGAVRIAAPPPGASFGMHVNTQEAKLQAEKQFKTESLGSKVIDGVMAEGTRSTRTIPAGEVGNEKPIEIVSEMWYSPDLKTIVYSKRSDPRSGDMIYSLTNISRSEPDASLFAPPADYKEAAAKDVFFYRNNE